MNQIGSLLDRPKSYYNIDGVGELSIAFLCLSCALLEWQQVRSREGSVWNQPYTLWIYFTLMASIIHYGSKAIKKHITYPRTGWVEYRTRDTIWKPMIISFAFSTIVSVVLFIRLKSHWDITTPLSLAGLVLAASYAHSFARTLRWKWVVAWAMAIVSIVIALLPADLIGAMANHSWITAYVPAKVVGALWLSMAAYGTMLLISGGISFWLYLQKTQAPAAEEP
jgi:hypothetical protein